MEKYARDHAFVHGWTIRYLGFAVRRPLQRRKTAVRYGDLEPAMTDELSVNAMAPNMSETFGPLIQ